MTNYRSKKPQASDNMSKNSEKPFFLLDKTKKTFSWSNEDGLKPNESERKNY